MSLLEIKGLETEFQTEQGVVKALRGINYTVDRGEVLGIVGESGSGKSVTAAGFLTAIQARFLADIRRLFP